MQRNIGILLGFAAGFAIGYNWTRIAPELKRGSVKAAGWATSTAEGLVRYAAEAKEKLEDAVAEMKREEEPRGKAEARATASDRHDTSGPIEQSAMTPSA
jgi:hypothetical protein